MYKHMHKSVQVLNTITGAKNENATQTTAAYQIFYFSDD